MNALLRHWGGLRSCHAFLERARECEARGEHDAAWANLEAAHIIGQQQTLPHVLSHWRMLSFAWRTRDAAELLGQFARLVTASLVTWIWVPTGNSGRSNVSPFAREAVPRDLAAQLRHRRLRP